MRHLTIRNLPSNLAAALEKEKQRRGKSLNKTVIQLLGQSLNLQPGCRRTNGLAHPASTWTAEAYPGIRGRYRSDPADRRGALAVSRFCLDTSFGLSRSPFDTAPLAHLAVKRSEPRAQGAQRKAQRKPLRLLPQRRQDIIRSKVLCAAANLGHGALCPKPQENPPSSHHGQLLRLLTQRFQSLTAASQRRPFHLTD